MFPTQVSARYPYLSPVPGPVTSSPSLKLPDVPLVSRLLQLFRSLVDLPQVPGPCDDPWDVSAQGPVSTRFSLAAVNPLDSIRRGNLFQVAKHRSLEDKILTGHAVNWAANLDVTAVN